ncbi:DNA-binding IclR family transcriptional regulator [Paraburkholderia sp. EB58]|uniref:IclR family transcriptional regulator n=1 Tax=Paraburkholderia sp. EB58 TaxID=3035125 RepID=UPI003D1E29BA
MLEDTSINMSNRAGSEREIPGIQSVEIGGTLIQALAEEGVPMTLTSIAKKAGMPTSKARRYLVSLITAGLVQQDSASGRYSPGPLALKIGLAALAQVDVVRQAEAILKELRDDLNETVVLAVWVDGKPVILRREDSYRPITLNIRIGSSVSDESSATARVFKAHGYGSELRHARSGLTSTLKAVLAQGFAEVCGDFVSGLYGISVPVLDGSNQIAAAITLVTQLSTVDDRRRRELQVALVEAGKKLSVSLGNMPV